MDLLGCPSCGRRFAVSGAGSLGGWRCTNCSSELQVVGRDVPRVDLLGETPHAFDDRLHALPPEWNPTPPE